MSTTASTVRKKIAIIGGGTGLTTAWALEQQGAFDVTLFEANPWLGGDARSITLNGVVLETGTEFIAGPKYYPLVHQLFEHLEVSLKKFKLNTDYHHVEKDKHLALPPVIHTASHIKSGSFSHTSLRFKNGVQKQTNVSMNTMLTQFINLLKIQKAVKHAKKHMGASSEVQSLEEFINDLRPHFSRDRNGFLEEFFYPLVASAWGVMPNMIKTFCAHYAMNYLIVGQEWYDLEDGLSDYINKLEAKCTRTKIYKNTRIMRIHEENVDGVKRYKLLNGDGTYVSDSFDNPILYDELVLAVPGNIVKNLIQDLTHPAILDLHAALANTDYYDTTIIFHQDPAFLSKKGTVVYSHYEGGIPANTMCKRWKFSPDEFPVLKSWVLRDHGQLDPVNQLATVYFKHPVMDKRYFASQEKMRLTQGIAGIRYGGILGGFNDSHESAIYIALKNAAELCAESRCLLENERLAMFADIVNEVVEEQRIRMNGSLHRVSI